LKGHRVVYSFNIDSTRPTLFIKRPIKGQWFLLYILVCHGQTTNAIDIDSKMPKLAFKYHQDSPTPFNEIVYITDGQHVHRWTYCKHPFNYC